ncbi:hypothetical protein [Streptomyces sp. Ag109_G2-15]|uniref:hypothetical protein n=1 Tax=Streptomyces sp. Ag109_G2-15 TaxID=1938850 RepID=UPI000BD39323|nr:hypothetical protein [Streptomyces sp. Ag109_G2-15]SOD85316.1 hypothetical protein SAMN06272765_2728 [Streptomyces sp. Ag109_G2-15]
MDAVRLRRLNRWQTESLKEDLADLYVESSDTAAGEGYHDRQDFLRRLTDDVRRPGFAMLVAETTTLVGCAFGSPVGRDGSWWQGFDATLPRSIEQLTASGHVFPVADHAARAAFQSWGWQDIGEVHRPLDPGPAVLRTLVLPLGGRTATNPDGLAHNAGTQRPA